MIGIHTYFRNLKRSNKNNDAYIIEKLNSLLKKLLYNYVRRNMLETPTLTGQGKNNLLIYYVVKKTYLLKNYPITLITSKQDFRDIKMCRQ